LGNVPRFSLLIASQPDRQARLACFARVTQIALISVQPQGAAERWSSGFSLGKWKSRAELVRNGAVRDGQIAMSAEKQPRRSTRAG